MDEEFFGFDRAINCIKNGLKVQRAGWNGKGMWVALTPGSGLLAGQARQGHAAAHIADELPHPQCEIRVMPHIEMRAADGSLVVGWLASQTDLLADDWRIVDDQ